MVIQFKNSKILWLNDSSEFFQTGFQDPASSVMDGIFLFNTHLVFIITSIVVLVAFSLFSLLNNYCKSKFSIFQRYNRKQKSTQVAFGFKLNLS